MRHAAGAISAGFAAGVAAADLKPQYWPVAQAAALAIFDSRERPLQLNSKWSWPIVEYNPPTKGQQADLNLNSVAVPIGFRLGVGYMRRSDLGTYIRLNICDPRFIKQ